MTKDSKEVVENPSEESTDETQPVETKEGDTSQKDENEGQETIEERLAKVEKKSSDFEKAYYSEKKKRQELEVKLGGDVQEEPNEVQSAVENALKAERIKSAFNDAIKIPELSEANDLDGVKYTKVKEAIEKKMGMIDGTSLETAKKDIGFIIQQELGTSPTQKDQTSNSEEEVVDSGLGDTTSQIKGSKQEPDALTRPLNTWEQSAVKMWASDKNVSLKEAEKQWREKKAKSEEVSTK